MNFPDVDRWVRGYLAAWQTDDPTVIADLFTAEARYFTEPYSAPWVGRDEIVSKWVESGDSLLTWSFQYQVVACDGDTAVIRGVTEYPNGTPQHPKPHTYDNVWLVRFDDDGRAREFTEFYMRRPSRSKPAEE